MTLREFFLRHYAPRFMAGPSHEKTRRLILTALDHLEHWQGADPTLDQVSPLFLTDFILYLENAPRANRSLRSHETALKNYRQIRAVASYAAQLEVIGPIPRIRLPQDEDDQAEEDDEEEEVPALTVEEIERMLDIARRLEGEIGGVPAATWWVCLILVLFNCGQRIAATLALRWVDYDDDRRALRFRRKTQKQRKTQSLGITGQTAQWIERIRGDRPLIFPWPFDPSGNLQTLDRHLRRKILGPAGVQDVKGHLFHRLRMATATELRIREEEDLAPKGAATEQLGHSGSAVTDKHYIAKGRLKPLRHCEALPVPAIAEDDAQTQLFETEPSRRAASSGDGGRLRDFLRR